MLALTIENGALNVQKLFIKRLNHQESSVQWLKEPVSLRRKGSRLMSDSQIWYMHNIREIETPVAMEPAEYFQIETHLGDELVVFQKNGARGMKEVFLVAVTRNKELS